MTMISLPAFGTTLAPPISVTVDGHFVHFQGQGPVIVHNRTFVPTREVFEMMGFTADWFPETRTATLISDSITIIIPIDASFFTVNGAVVIPDVPQMIINNTLMLPLAAIAEAIGGSAGWDSLTQMAVITTAGRTPPPPPPPPIPLPTPVPPTQVRPAATPAPGTATPGAATPTPTSPPAGQATPGTTPPPQATPQPTPQPTPAGTTPGPQTTPSPQATPTPPAATPTTTTPPTTGAIPNRRLTQAELNTWISNYHSGGGINSFEQEVFRLINIERENADLPALSQSPILMMASRFKAQSMYTLGYFSHQNPVYGHFANISRELFNYPISAMGENIARNQQTAQEVVAQWMASPTHRNNILHRNFTEMGVGFYNNYWANKFGNAGTADTPAPTG